MRGRQRWREINESETEKQRKDRKTKKETRETEWDRKKKNREIDIHTETHRDRRTHTHTHTRRAVVSSVKLIFPVSPVICSQRSSSFFSLLLCLGGFTLHITNSTGVSEVGWAEEAQVSDYRMCWWNLKKTLFPGLGLTCMLAHIIFMTALWDRYCQSLFNQKGSEKLRHFPGVT